MKFTLVWTSYYIETDKPILHETQMNSSKLLNILIELQLELFLLGQISIDYISMSL